MTVSYPALWSANSQIVIDWLEDGSVKTRNVADALTRSMQNSSSDNFERVITRDTTERPYIIY